MADPSTGNIQTKIRLCTLLIAALRTANELSPLNNIDGVIRNLQFARDDGNQKAQLVQMGVFPASVVLNTMDTYIKQAKDAWAKPLGQNVELSDVVLVRNIYNTMLERPGAFSDTQIEHIRTLINWFDDQGHSGGFAFGQQHTDGNVVALVPKLVGECVSQQY